MKIRSNIQLDNRFIDVFFKSQFSKNVTHQAYFYFFIGL